VHSPAASTQVRGSKNLNHGAAALRNRKCGHCCSVSNVVFRRLYRDTGLRPVHAMLDNRGIFFANFPCTGQRPVSRWRFKTVQVTTHLALRSPGQNKRQSIVGILKLQNNVKLQKSTKCIYRI
jgi:hypothetical protein